MRLQLSATGWVALQNLFAQVFGLALFALQAPLLGPRAFGLITIVMIFVGFCEFVLEIAATEGLVSVRDIEPAHYATMTTFNGAIALVLGLVVAGAAGPIAQLFSEPDLVPVLRVMAVLPLMSALLSAPNAATRRAMEFRPLAIRTIFSIATGGSVGLILSFLGYGVWALVWQAVIQRALNVGILWAIVPIRFSLGFSRRHFAELWRYTGPMLVSQVMTWGAGQIPRFILGFYLGAAELGLFSLASRLNEILLQLTLSPRFAVARMEMQRHRDQAEGLEAALHGVLRDMAVLCFPMCIGAAALMAPLFRLWLDERWAGGVFTAQIMMLTCLPYVTHYALSTALLGLGRQSLVAFNSAIQTAITAALTLIFAPLGLNAAASSIAVRPLLTAPLPALQLARLQRVSPAGVLTAQLPLLSCAIVMGVTVFAAEHILRPLLPVGIVFPLLVLVGVVLYGALALRVEPQAVAPYWQRALALWAKLRRNRSAG